MKSYHIFIEEEWLKIKSFVYWYKRIISISSLWPRVNRSVKRNCTIYVMNNEDKKLSTETCSTLRTPLNSGTDENRIQKRDADWTNRSNELNTPYELNTPFNDYIFLFLLNCSPSVDPFPYLYIIRNTNQLITCAYRSDALQAKERRILDVDIEIQHSTKLIRFRNPKPNAEY